MNLLHIISAVATIGMFAFLIGIKFVGESSLTNSSLDATGGYISTKDNISYIRSGPGKDYPILFTYYTKAFPLAILSTYNDWYYVEDYIGNKGWIFISITSKKQTAITISPSANIYKNYNNQSKILAKVKRNYILDLIKCDSTYTLCEVGFSHNDNYLKGWISSQDIWGKTKP